MMRTRNKKISASKAKDIVNIKLLRSSACLDVIHQIPEGRFDIDNWKITCDYCFNILMDGKDGGIKVNDPKNKRHRRNQYLLKDIAGDAAKIEALKYDLLCRVANDAPINANSATLHPSKQRIINKTVAIPTESSPTPPLLQCNMTPAAPIAPPLETHTPPLAVPTTLSPVACPMPISPLVTHPSSTSPPASNPRLSAFTRVKKEALDELRFKVKKYDDIIAFTKQRRYVFNNAAARRLVGIDVSFAPMLSLVAATRFISLMHHALFKELDLEVSAKEIVNITPTHTLLSNIVVDAAAESLAISRMKFRGSPIFGSADASNKDGAYHMVKEGAKWDHSVDRLFTCTIDAD